MSEMINFAKRELDRIGLTENADEMDKAMRDHILTMVAAFSDEGHSGFSASYALGLLKKLLALEPLGPLTGDDDEWMEVYQRDNGETVYQNTRLSSVFKEETAGAYNIDGKVFWEWFTDPETGEVSKSYFTSSDSRVPVEFPYTVPDKPIYEFRPSADDTDIEGNS